MFKLHFKEKELEQIQIKAINNFEEACELAKYYSKKSKYDKVFLTTPDENVFIFEKGRFID